MTRGGSSSERAPWAAQGHVDEKADVPHCQVLVQNGEPVQNHSEHGGDVGTEDTDEGGRDDAGDSGSGAGTAGIMAIPP